MCRYFCVVIFWLSVGCVYSQKLVEVGEGWASNSVNTTIFRKNSLVTHGESQYIAYYDVDGFLVVGKRKLTESRWTVSKSQHKGKVTDAHNSISIMVDGDGFLHVAWDHHGHPLRYVRSVAPESLILGEKEPMTGTTEDNVTYPEFFKLPSGDLIFMYRDGHSGGGNLVMNRYDLKSRKWIQVQNNLIDGEGKRNAYWQACVDKKGTIHLSWVWRETWDVATNHDMCYARSYDGGVTWVDSGDKRYDLPINAGNAEYALNIPQRSELINQTSITTDGNNNPYIASYWRSGDSSVPQFHVVYYDGKRWVDVDLGFRHSPFSLSGGGTKRIPISRPQIIVDGKGRRARIMVLFRDEERGSKVSLAECVKPGKRQWQVRDLTDWSVGSWEPSFDTELWKSEGRLHVFVQHTQQVDGEGRADVDAQKVFVLEMRP